MVNIVLGVRMELIEKDKTFNIIGACYEVYNHLGSGFLEPVYQEALAFELYARNIPFEKEKLVQIHYKEHILEKHYSADFVCYQNIIVELKAVSELTSIHKAQLFNYLKATGYKLGLLINFGEEKVKFERIVY